MNIYTLNIRTLIIFIVLLGLFWVYINYRFKHEPIVIIFRWTAFIVSVYIILEYTVMHREKSDMHVFVFGAEIGRQIFRELFMNTILFLPFGLSAGAVIGLWCIPIALLMSAGIEAWQYFAGTGLAQGTDVICNTLGCCIGMVFLWVGKKLSDITIHR